MTILPDITQTLLACKKAKGLSFADLEPLVGLDEICIAAIIYRQATATPDEARKLTAALGLGPEVADQLTDYPIKGLGPVVPTDPLVYRFYEIMQHVEKVEDPKGDRIQLTLNGKFLAYKKW
mgnify:CR=1 FL=1